MQILMFAPDWSLSTFRAMYKGLPGTNSKPLSAQLHRNYLMRTAVIWGVLMNGYNLAVGGKPIWDNKDPTKIEYKDGTTQQVAKHAMEGAEWAINPRQTMLNKFGYVPKEMATQLQGVEYLSTKGNAPKMDSRLGHALKGILPMSAQQTGVEGRGPLTGLKNAVMSSLGAPTYGMTAEEKVASKEAKAKKKRKLQGYDE